MIRIDWYVADAEQDTGRLGQAMQSITESFGGVTVTHAQGGWHDPTRKRILYEDSYVFTVLVDDPVASETRARMMADRLLDIFHSEKEVMFAITPVIGDTIRRQAVSQSNDTTGDRHVLKDNNR